MDNSYGSDDSGNDSSGYRSGTYLSHDGLTLYYRDYDSIDSTQDVTAKPTANDGLSHRYPILCLHGLTRNSKDFELLAPWLVPDYRLIVPDIRGRGLSAYDSDYSRYTPLTYVQDCWRLLDHLSVAKVVVIGTSMGGLMAMLMAAEQPDRIASIVLNDIGPELAPEGLNRIKSHVGKSHTYDNWQAAVAGLKQTHSDFYPNLCDEDWLSFAKRLFKENESNTLEANYDANIARAFTDQPLDLWTLYGSLPPIPLLVIRGALSDLLSEAIVQKMALIKPDLQWINVPNRGHTPFLDEQPVVDELRRFLLSKS